MVGAAPRRAARTRTGTAATGRSARRRSSAPGAPWPGRCRPSPSGRRRPCPASAGTGRWCRCGCSRRPCPCGASPTPSAAACRWNTATARPAGIEAVDAVGLPPLRPTAPRCRRASACRGRWPSTGHVTGGIGRRRRSVGAPSPAMLRLYDTATREVRELALREPGKVGIYLCGPTVYGPPHIGHGRATLDVRHPAPLPRVDAASRCASSRTSPTSTTRSSSAPTGAAAVAGHRRASASGCGSRRWTRINVERPTDIPHATEYVDEMVEMIGELVELGGAYVTDDGVYLVGRDGGRLRAAGPPVRSTTCVAGGGDREVFGAERQAPPRRLRAVEAGQAGRAVVAVAVGRRPPGLAQRVRGDEPRPARGGLRPPLRRPWTCASPPRERARPGRGPRPALRQPLDAQRLRRRRRGREDVEDRSATSTTCSTSSTQYDPRAYRTAAAPGALPQPDHRSPTTPSGPPSKPLAGLDAFAARGAAVGRRAGARRRRPRSSVRRPRWTTTSTPRGAMALVFDTVRRANAALDAEDGAAPAAGRGRCGMRRHGRPRAAGRRRRPRRRRERAAASTPPGPPRTSPTADAIRAALQADGWMVETRQGRHPVRR